MIHLLGNTKMFDWSSGMMWVVPLFCPVARFEDESAMGWKGAGMLMYASRLVEHPKDFWVLDKVYIYVYVTG